MGTIVCATRIGENSRIVQMRAIDMARERGDQLIFLYVVNVNTLGEIEKNLEAAARMELEWFGRALLEIAQNRARRSGVDAEIEIRHGGVEEEIGIVLRDRAVDLLILGSPRPRSEQKKFTQTAIEEFAQNIERQTGVEVRIIAPNS